MPITPGGRVSPDVGDDYDLVTDLAAMQVSNETASANEIANIRQNYRVGTNAQRLAIPAAQLVNGLEFFATDTGYTWRYNGTSWTLRPRVISRVSQSSNVTYTAGGTALPGMSISVTLPAAARLRATVATATYSSGTADIAVIRLRDGTSEIYSYTASANSSPSQFSTTNSHAFVYDWNASSGSHTINVAAFAALGSGGTASASQSFMTLEVIE